MYFPSAYLVPVFLAALTPAFSCSTYIMLSGYNLLYFRQISFELSGLPSFTNIIWILFLKPMSCFITDSIVSDKYFSTLYIGIITENLYLYSYYNAIVDYKLFLLFLIILMVSQ